MNWATIARNERIYKGKDLYRWDVSPGLEHHCGTCATPLHNARAKNSCIGKHVEPCQRYHQQLHFVGKSHECFGCCASAEHHYARHKEILGLIRGLAAYDSQTSMGKYEKRKSASEEGSGIRRSSFVASTDASSDAFEENIANMTKRARKKAEKEGLGARTKQYTDVEVISQEDIDFISEALHLTKHDSKGAWKGMSSENVTESKSLTDPKVSSPEQTEEDEVDGDDEESLSSSILLIPKQAAFNSPKWPTPKEQRASKAKRSVQPLRQSKQRGHTQKFKPNANADLYDGLDPNIFYRLNVDVNTINSTKARRDIVTKLIAAIKNDFEILAREDEEARIREEGFWRWAGKGAYYKMRAVREELDWSTGQRKDKGRISELSESAIDEESEVPGLTADNTEAEEEDTEEGNGQNNKVKIPMPSRVIGKKGVIAVKSAKKKDVNKRRAPIIQESESDFSETSFNIHLSEQEVPDAARPWSKVAEGISTVAKAFSGTLKINVPSPVIEQNEDGWTQVAPRKGKGAARK